MKRPWAIPLAATLLGCALVSRANAEDCKVDGWRHYEDPLGIIAIDGSTTCECGRVHIRAYDGDRFIGADTAFVEGYKFSARIPQAPMPSQMKIKTTVEARPC